MKRLPRIVISACQGHLGKTTVSLGLCAAWAEKGLEVQPFKKGADYIDPSWLSAAAGRTCRNLDAFLMPQEDILLSFQHSCRGADIALMEGVMGLYDSYDNHGEGSTAWMARLLEAPVILLINASRMTRSVAAVIKGYQSFEPETKIAGVILNNVSLSGHQRKLRAAVEKYCDVPVLGALPKESRFCMAEQHLGLRPYRSTEDAGSIILRLRSAVKSYVDVEGILQIAEKNAAVLPVREERVPKPPLVRIGVLLDKAFTFYYPENMEALRRAGAELVFIDSTNEKRLPEVDGLYIGGGFPELFAPRLEANSLFRGDLARAVENDLPVYAECAGLMYLCRNLVWGDRRYEMVGAIPSDVEMCLRTQGHGYVIAEVTGKNPWFPLGFPIRGHQFHHSRLIEIKGLEFVLRMRRKRDGDPETDGIIRRNLFASYTHTHAFSIPGWAETFVSLAQDRKKGWGSVSLPSF